MKLPILIILVLTAQASCDTKPRQAELDYSTNIYVTTEGPAHWICDNRKPDGVKFYNADSAGRYVVAEAGTGWQCIDSDMVARFAYQLRMALGGES